MATLTEFGKEIRKLRIERGETMLAMSEKLGKSPSFLSAVETGRKPVPVQLVEDLANAYALPAALKERLGQLAAMSITAFKLTPERDVDRALVAAFAMKLPTLDEEKRRSIMQILQS